MQRFLAILRDDWPRFLLEIVVLVLGITGSFALDQWRRDREDAQTARRFLVAIHDDLVSDSLMLTRMSGRVAVIEAAHRSLLAQPDPDSLDVWMDLTISYAGFARTDVAYQELVQTGNTRLLRETGVVEGLIRLYQRPYTRTAEWDRINREYVLDRMIPYMDRNAPTVPYDADGAVTVGLGAAFPALRRQPEYQNLLRTGLTFRAAQRTVYAQTMVELRTLLARTDSVLAR